MTTQGSDGRSNYSVSQIKSIKMDHADSPRQTRNTDPAPNLRRQMFLGYFQSSTGLSSRAKKWLTALSLLACIGLFLFHFLVIRKYAVNIAYWDEWALFQDDHLAALSLKWLFAQHNEHRIVTLKLFVWLQYQLNGWNHVEHQILNFIIYGASLTWLIWIAKKLAPQVQLWVILSFITFLLSPINLENHTSGFQSSFHFWLLFYLVSSYFLFSPRQNWRRLVIGCLASILSIYSLAGGLISSLTLLLTFCLFKGVRAYSAKNSQERTRDIFHSILVVVLLGGAIALWFIGYQRPSYHPSLSLPYQLAFWRHFLNIVAFGFGIDEVSTKLGGICLLIVITPIIWQVWQQRTKLTISQWATCAVVLGILGFIASTSIGRAGFGVEQAKSSRYAEVGMPLIILSVLNWSYVLQRRQRSQTKVLLGLWVFCLIAFSNNWSFDVYRRMAANRMAGVRCVKAYYEYGGDARCPTISPGSISTNLEQAKKLNSSLYRDISAEIQHERQRTSSATAASYFGIHRVADCQHPGGVGVEHLSAISSAQRNCGDKLYRLLTDDEELSAKHGP